MGLEELPFQIRVSVSRVRGTCSRGAMGEREVRTVSGTVSEGSTASRRTTKRLWVRPSWYDSRS